MITGIPANFVALPGRNLPPNRKNAWLKQPTPKKPLGFPDDDCNSLCQRASDYQKFDIYYDYQFMQNETMNAQANGVRAVYTAEHTPIVAGTACFTVYIGTTAVQIGHEVNGAIHFDKIGNPTIYVEAGGINHVTGELTLRFNQEPKSTSVVMSYEYSLECQPNEV